MDYKFVEFGFRGNKNVVGVVVVREFQNGGVRLARRLGGWHTLVI